MRDYMALLIGAGREPDTWTAAIIDRQTRDDEAAQAAAEQANAQDTESAGTDDARQPDHGEGQPPDQKVAYAAEELVAELGAAMCAPKPASAEPAPGGGRRGERRRHRADRG